ncbi:hypothetical protein [Bacillus sp. SN10]|uniref:hypothetical protein n=1 Tax=Bacillus sp. SN10 TaxID=2056493 RepID=UPI000C33797B|nr:hypothetical protein [Bacillus sp. SN10]PKJ54535.1 hypothetical protein CWE34_18005 [Bacillus sp. SN10]
MTFKKSIAVTLACSTLLTIVPMTSFAEETKNVNNIELQQDNKSVIYEGHNDVTLTDDDFQYDEEVIFDQRGINTYCYPAIKCVGGGKEVTYSRGIPDMGKVSVMNGVLVGAGLNILNIPAWPAWVISGLYGYYDYKKSPGSMKIYYSSWSKSGVSKLEYFAGKNYTGKKVTVYR